MDTRNIPMMSDDTLQDELRNCQRRLRYTRAGINSHRLEIDNLRRREDLLESMEYRMILEMKARDELRKELGE